MAVPLETVVEEADAAYHRGRCDQAVEMLLGAIAADRSQRRLYLKLAELLFDSERFQDAVDILSKAPPDETDGDAIALMGCCQEALGDTAGAAGAADRALGLNPHGALALTLKGMVAARREARSDAEGYYREAISCGDSGGQAHWRLGLLHLEQNRAAEALSVLEAGFRQSPNVRGVAIHYHGTAVALKEHERAERTFHSVLLRRRHHRRLRFLHIDLLLRTGRPQAAMSEIESAMVCFRPRWTFGGS
jgi:tetratricopeptide (TPR) repeat protein